MTPREYPFFFCSCYVPKLQFNAETGQTEHDCGGGRSSRSKRRNYPSSRIVGGVPRSAQEFPSFARLKWQGSHTCGGSVITTAYVLTAMGSIYSVNYLLKSGLIS